MSLGAFRVRSYRFQWSADLLTSWASEMETIILGWYVLTSTGSVLLLTVFGSLQFLGTLVAPLFGVLGDRLGARTMLCAMRAVYVGLAAGMTGLALAGAMTPGWVFALATLTGLVRPNDLIMRNSLIGQTIGPVDLMGALGMSRRVRYQYLLFHRGLECLQRDYLPGLHARAAGSACGKKPSPLSRACEAASISFARIRRFWD